jgi:hypothetical protein
VQTVQADSEAHQLVHCLSGQVRLKGPQEQLGGSSWTWRELLASTDGVDLRSDLIQNLEQSKVFYICFGAKMMAALILKLIGESLPFS